jgi:hypothetical protein
MEQVLYIREVHATRICSRDIQQGHAAGTCSNTCSNTCSMDMQQGHAAGTCSMDMHIPYSRPLLFPLLRRFGLGNRVSSVLRQKGGKIFSFFALRIRACEARKKPEVWPPPPPRGSNPTLWPLPQDLILGVAPPRGLNPTVWPPPVIRDRGSDFPLWPLSGDLTFGCSLSQGIRLSAMAPPRGSDFPQWPLPRDRTFHSGPSQGIKGHTAGSFEFLQSMQLPLKGQPVKNVSMVEQYYPKPITFMLVICSSLKKKLILQGGGGGHTVGSASNSNFSVYSNLHSKRLLDRNP